MAKYVIVCPNCEQSKLSLVIGKNSQECEICPCGFPENVNIKEWVVA